MSRPKELFLLDGHIDSPIFEGFGRSNYDEPSLLGRENISEDMIPGYRSQTREWQPTRLASVWKPLKVEGRVVPFNDYPCVDGKPAFSKRACEILRPYLEPNGELLPLDSTVGEYFFFNITTVADVLNVAKSDCKMFTERPWLAIHIDRYEFFAERLDGLSIFRICDRPGNVIVTDEFVRTVHDNGLQGFNFQKIWPTPEGMDWLRYNRELARSEKRPADDLDRHTLVVMLGLSGKAMKAGEKRKIKKIEGKLDALLTLQSPTEPYYGTYSGSDEVGAEYRMFMNCPDADKLVKRLTGWLDTLDWNGKVVLVKRYGEMYDEDAREEFIQYSE